MRAVWVLRDSLEMNWKMQFRLLQQNKDTTETRTRSFQQQTRVKSLIWGRREEGQTIPAFIAHLCEKRTT